MSARTLALAQTVDVVTTGTHRRGGHPEAASRNCSLRTTKSRTRLAPGAAANAAKLVPGIGIEPTTYALRMRRSTN